MIVSCGEALVDLMPERQGGALVYRALLGGSPFTVALGIARLGGRSAYLWELSTDTLGCDFHDALVAGAVDTRAVRRAARATPVAIVDLTGSEPRYNIADPDRVMHETALPALPAETQCLVIGSAVLAQQPVADAIEALARTAPLVAIDYNVRLPSIVDLATYRARLERLSAAAGIVKASVADLAMIGIDDAEGYMRQMIASGAALAVLTAGAEGATAFTAGACVRRRAEPTRFVDAVGAGDAFMAALLAELQSRGALDRGTLSRMGEADIDHHLRVAQRAAAVTCSRQGAVMPFARDVRADAAMAGHAS